jgi:hypothetical protein
MTPRSVGQEATLLGQRDNGLFLEENLTFANRCPVVHTETPCAQILDQGYVRRTDVGKTKTTISCQTTERLHRGL